MSVGTAFHPRTSELNTKMAWGEWAGYWSAAVYADFHDIEYNAIREAAAMFDTSPLYKYRIGGREATKFLGRVLARDINTCRDGQAQYTLWLDERGYVIEDGVIFRFASDDFILTSAQCSYRKPHPRIFELAIANWYFLPSETVMVGDNLDADIRGAKSAGLYGIWISRRAGSSSEDEPRVQPDATISSLTELPALLDRLQI